MKASSKVIKPKELEALLKVCRKHGVTELKVEGLELRLESVPQEAPKTSPLEAPVSPTQGVSPMPSEEDLMYWSSTQ